MYTREQAIEIMNNWGMQHIPFLFIIDFEMRAIRLFRTDLEIPESIWYTFPLTGVYNPHLEKSNDIFFRKYPIPFSIYQQSFNKVLKQIKTGNSFLLNLTMPTRIETNLSLQEIYLQSQSKYKLLVDTEFVCFSPETFITITNGLITSCPMKGTIKASVSGAAEIVLNDPKETAEHHTIVDLIRNDLSMVAADVIVKRFRYIERIITHEGDILQVSSEISGKLPSDYENHMGTIIFTLLPAGSVTGAPKQKTIEIIRQVEGNPRGYYTGIFGRFDGKNLDSAVLIRFIEKKNNELWFRSGGGITHLSDPECEYNELIDKAYVPIT